MSEPQARSTLGTCWRTVCAPLPLLAGALFALGTVTTPAMSQIRGYKPSVRSTSRWWLSGGTGAVTITDIQDGATQSTWKFGSDPTWMWRGSIERSVVDEFTTFGVSASYGNASLIVSPLSGATGGVALPASCSAGCSAQSQVYSLMGQFRSGGGRGFHTLLEASAGVMGVRNLRTSDSAAVAIGAASGTRDLSGTLGPGFGFGFSPGFGIALVQDFGIGFHSKAFLPSGVSRTWRVRTTRASVRLSF